MNEHLIAVFAAFGLVYGVILQRSGFCFSQAAFEVFYLRSRDAVNGVMVGLIVATTGFGAVTLVRQHLGLPSASHLLQLPVGLGTVVGGLLFGLGMTIAGMCAVGTLQRLGEGYGLAWAVFVGVLVGAATFPFQDLFTRLTAHSRAASSLSASMSPLAGAGLTLVALGALWIVLLRAGRSAPRSSRPRRDRVFSLAVPAVYGGLALGLVNTLQMAVSTPWTAGYPLALIPSLMSASARSSLPAVAAPLALNVGLVAGAAVSSLLQRQLRLSWPRRGSDLAVALLGGVLMGWGIRAGHACNIGGVFSSIPSLAVSGWLYLAGLIPGAWLGTRLTTRSLAR
jgi:uncharacterized membrane protein YedE/YeeE